MATFKLLIYYFGVTAVLQMLVALKQDNENINAERRRDSDRSLCECYGVSLDSISGMISAEESNTDEADEDEVVCYTYSIHYDLERAECQSPTISVAFGACTASRFTTQTLQDSLIAIYHFDEQLTDSSYSVLSSDYDDIDSNSLLGLEVSDLVPSSNNDQLTICMQHVNDDGRTSHNVEFVVNNNTDIISCHNQQGLPCMLDVNSRVQSRLRTDIQLQSDAEQPAAATSTESAVSSSEQSNPSGDSPRPSHALPMEYDTKYKTIPAEQAEQKVAEVLNRASRRNPEIADSFELQSAPQKDELAAAKQSMSISARRWIKFAFVTIMIFIGLNALCCTLLALRQSGALDKYFDEVKDEEDVDEFDEEYTPDDARQIDADIDDEEDIDDDDDFGEVDNGEDDDDDNDVSISRQARPIFDEITFSDLVAMRQKQLVEDNDCDEFDDDDDGDDDEDEQDAQRRTLKIYISQLEETQGSNVDTPFKE